MLLRESLSQVRRQPIHAECAHVGWNVFLGAKQIDTVYYNRSCTAQYVRETLIKHDGYDGNIVVRRS